MVPSSFTGAVAVHSIIPQPLPAATRLLKEGGVGRTNLFLLIQGRWNGSAKSISFLSSLIAVPCRACRVVPEGQEQGREREIEKDGQKRGRKGEVKPPTLDLTLPIITEPPPELEAWSQLPQPCFYGRP